MTTAKKDRVSRRRERVREDILEVTGQLIVRRGFANVTLAGIARELELTKPALYYYFSSKDDLMFEVVFERLERQVDVIEASYDGVETAADALEAMIRAMGDYYATRYDEFRLVYMAGQVGASAPFQPQHMERIRPLNDRTFGPIEALIRREQQDGLIDASIDARRAPFVAHAAVLGVLTMEGLVDAGNDGPLLHGHSAMLDDLVRLHTAPLRH